MPSFHALLPIVALGLLQLQSANAAALDYRNGDRGYVHTVTVTACPGEPTSSPPIVVHPPISVPITTKITPASITSSIGRANPTPALPVNGGATELPAPLSNLVYKYTTFGRGFQNYSCPTNASAAPVSVGALAVLFDLTRLEKLSPKSVDAIPALAVNIPFQPATNNGRPFTIPGVGSFPVIGHHFFTSALVPVFDLTATGESIFAKKIAAIPAPSTASKGPLGTGAVPWLALEDNGTGLSKGLGEVYRVVTAGGVAPATCAGMKPDANGIITVNYAAEYWFYGTGP